MSAAPSPWHISARADMAAYHWSWLPIFVALLFFGPTYPTDFLAIALPILGLNVAHQALTILLVYGDREVFARDARKLTVFPTLLLAGFLASLWLWNHRFQPGTIGIADVFAIVAALAVAVQAVVLGGPGGSIPRWATAGTLGSLFVLMAVGTEVPTAIPTMGGAPAILWALAALSFGLARFGRGEKGDNDPAIFLRTILPVLLGGAALAASALPAVRAEHWPSEPWKARNLLIPVTVVVHIWNLWHFYRQKFGILRMHAAKSGVPAERAVPPRIDEFLVFGWFPLLAVIVGPAQGHLIVKHYKGLKAPLEPILEWITAWQSTLLPFAAAFLIATLGLWARAEWRASGLRNPARVSAAMGLTVLSACILFIDPVKGVLALGFSHITEYLVFVWAFERRYYATPRQTWLAKWMTRPALVVFGAAATMACVYIYLAFWGRYIATDEARPSAFGVTAGRLLGAFGSSLAMFHFYVDGFVWKMRRPEVRGNL